MNGFELFIFMVFAHLLADWTLQTPIQANNKATNWYIMGLHCFVWTTAVFVPLMLVGYHIVPIAFLLMWLIHYFVDTWKCLIVWDHGEDGKKKWNADAFKPWHLYVDQGIHLIQIVGLWLFYILT